ncbi:MAG TPA: RNA 2',3'-cyclic phosphodiesterase [Acholeplasmatales bacterium]|nr:RNA 2',3'-cyclic phosphodiesterase [Acholeplasmatales bacterium]
MRAFIGIDLPDCKPELVKIQERLKNQSSAGNFTLSSNLHLTVLFLGDIDSSMEKEVRSVLEKLSLPPFEITITGLTNLRDMIIAQIGPSGPLSELYRLLFENLSALGLALENRPFFPHVTLVRKTGLKAEESLGISAKVREIILFASERIEGVLTYRPVHRKKLTEE